MAWSPFFFHVGVSSHLLPGMLGEDVTEREKALPNKALGQSAVHNVTSRHTVSDVKSCHRHVESGVFLRGKDF